MQSEDSIRRAAAELDAALEAGDPDRVVACFDPECTIDLLGVRLNGHDGVRRWLDWVFGHVSRIAFDPRLIAVVDDVTFIEEFGVRGVLADGRALESGWAEILTYRHDLLTSLRLYFNPRDLAPALGVIGRVVGPTAVRIARRGLAQFDPIPVGE